MTKNEATVQVSSFLEDSSENLFSRSQAKNLLQSIESYDMVVFDFEGITQIGQAFADEIFRVFAIKKPNVEIQYKNATPDVEAWIKRALILKSQTPS